MSHSIFRTLFCIGMLLASGRSLAAQQNIEVCTGNCPTITNVLPVSFPAQSQAVSPDGRYAVVDIDSDRKPYHRVFLEDRFLHTSRNLFNYEQHVVILWDADSRMFAATDYIGSDTSTCSIISVDGKAARTAALDLLFRQLGEDAKKVLQSQLSNHRVYVEASEWWGSTSLVVTISGYGDRDAKGFKQAYDVLLPSEGSTSDKRTIPK